MCRSLGVVSTKRWRTWRAGSWASLQAACRCPQLCMDRAGELSVGSLASLCLPVIQQQAATAMAFLACLQPSHPGSCLACTTERRSVLAPLNPTPPYSGPILLDKLICSPYVNEPSLDECNYSDEPSSATNDSHDYVRPGGLQTSRGNACATALTAHCFAAHVPAHALALCLLPAGCWAALLQ